MLVLNMIKDDQSTQNERALLVSFPSGLFCEIFFLPLSLSRLFISYLETPKPYPSPQRPRSMVHQNGVSRFPPMAYALLAKQNLTITDNNKQG